MKCYFLGCQTGQCSRLLGLPEDKSLTGNLRGDRERPKFSPKGGQSLNKETGRQSCDLQILLAAHPS